jgi:hypothetical protein
MVGLGLFFRGIRKLSILLSFCKSNCLSVPVENGVVLAQEDITQDPKRSFRCWNVKRHKGTGAVFTLFVDIGLFFSVVVDC